MMSDSKLGRDALIKVVAPRLVGAIVALLAVVFWPAGTFDYWEGWLCLAILFIPMGFIFIYLVKNDPELLERRMRKRERESTQKLVIALSIPYLLSVFILPGLDHRFGWSNAPALVVIATASVMLIGYGLFFLVLRENRYASRVIEVAEGQQVISSGPYALVRHPCIWA